MNARGAHASERYTIAPRIIKQTSHYANTLRTGGIICNCRKVFVIISH